MAIDPVTRGEMAKSVITNPVFVDAFLMLEALYKDKMAATDPEEVEERNKWHALLFNLKSVKTSLEATIQNGIADAEIAKARERAKHDGRSAGNRGK